MGAGDPRRHVAFSLLFGIAGVYVLLTQRGARISPVTEATAAAGPGLAVLPLRVVGPGLELWREGMIDLLSTNLDGVAGLRKIDPRAVLSRWRAEIGEGKDAPDPEAALEVARKLGASYAVLGSAVALGAGVRLTAEVYDLSTGKVQGTALAEGQQDSVFALVNRVSIEVLQTTLKGERGGPRDLDLTRVTTTSLPALKALPGGRAELSRQPFHGGDRRFHSGGRGGFDLRTGLLSTLGSIRMGGGRSSQDLRVFRSYLASH